MRADAEATPAQPPAPAIASAAELLTTAAAAGLLPRPGTGSHFRPAGAPPASVLHLDRVPFAVRAARHTARR